eukprot:4972769-Prymnesium_polylepis.1
MTRTKGAAVPHRGSHIAAAAAAAHSRAVRRRPIVGLLLSVQVCKLRLLLLSAQAALASEGRFGDEGVEALGDGAGGRAARLLELLK